MMSVTVAVSGQAVAEVSVMNRGPVSDVERRDPGGARFYDVTLWRRADDAALELVARASLVHSRRDGLLVLAAKALDVLEDAGGFEAIEAGLDPLSGRARE